MRRRRARAGPCPLTGAGIEQADRSVRKCGRDARTIGAEHARDDHFRVHLPLRHAGSGADVPGLDDLAIERHEPGTRPIEGDVADPVSIVRTTLPRSMSQIRTSESFGVPLRTRTDAAR